MSTALPVAKRSYFTAIDAVASFPEVMTAIRTAIADPAATPTTVGRAVERDVAFASRLLRIVNAPTVGLIRPCASVPHAVALVGLKRIGMHAENAASLAALAQCASIAPEVTKRAAIEAAIARTLAAEVGVSPERAFTAALLADIGVVAIIATQAGWVGGAISCGEERIRLGFDHAELGSEVLTRWHLPSPVPEIVRYHHDLDGALAASKEVARYVAVLQAAEYLAPGIDGAAETGDPGPEEWELIASHPSLQHLGIDATRLARLWPSLLAGIDADARASVAPPADREDEEIVVHRAPPPKESRKAFYVALAAAVAIPAAIGFELFYR